MTKFEEELFNKVPCKFELTTEAEYKKSTLINHFKNWHSDEEFQELSEKLDDTNDALVIAQNSRDEFEREYKKLKYQLQQQALPVVPECVGEWIDKNISVAHNAELMIHNILICAIDNKNRYLFPLEVEKFVLKNPITFLNAVITGKYQIEKPQLFKLIFPNSTAVLQKDGELNSFADTVYKRYLIGNAMTEQEIKSIDERYWQFAVPVEDGE